MAKLPDPTTEIAGLAPRTARGAATAMVRCGSADAEQSEVTAVNRTLSMEPTCQQDVLRPGMERVLCDLCHSNDSEVIMKQRDLLLNVTDDEFSVVRCRSCGLV